jgi:sodium-dependent dicarboxylate transporter 2/3/5
VSGASGPGRSRSKRAGFVAGPVLAVLTYAALPEVYTNASGETVEVTRAACATAGVAAWMAVWWLTEAIEIYATALLPLVLLPLLGATSMKAAAAPYAHDLIFLFMGGFLIGLTMERWGLQRRLALTTLGLAGDRPAGIVAAFLGVTALLSMWVSNTATAVMMLPVGLSVIELVDRQIGGESREARATRRNFALCLLLAIAYGASIGGIGTPVGTPPNLFLVSFMKANLGREVSFVRWMGVALPLIAVFLPITWWMLTRVLYPIRIRRIEGSAALVRRSLADLGPMGPGERVTLAVFALAAGLWVTRPLLMQLEVGGLRPLAGLSDAGIAMLAALLLFVTPVTRGGSFALDWPTAVRLPWGILVLFGGGLSLAATIQAVGLGELIGAQAVALAGTPTWLIVAGVVTAMVFLTELTSNTATTATLIPILAALAPGLGVAPELLIVPAAIAASCAFMLPVATPPNAIIFGSGHITIPEMSRAGFWLNWIGVVLVTALTYAVVIPLLVHR